MDLYTLLGLSRTATSADIERAYRRLARRYHPGVNPGDRYAIYRDFHNNLPLVYVADVVVMTVEQLTSKVVVTQTVDSIEPGDIAVPRTRVQD